MNPRSQPRRLNRLLLLSLLHLMGGTVGVQAQDYYIPPQPQQRKPLLQSVKSWWERMRAPKADYDRNPYAYPDAKQPVHGGKQPVGSDGSDWQQVPPIQYDWKERTYQFSKELDKLNKEVEEWGTIQMAPLVLAPARYYTPAETYPFALDSTSPALPASGQSGTQNQNASNATPLGLQGLYNDYAKSEGGSLSIVREQYKASADIRPTATTANASGIFNPTTAGGSGAGAAGTAGNSLAGLGDSANNQLATSTKVDMTSASFSPHYRLIEAADTSQVKNILTLMGRPEAALQYKDRKLLYGVTTVSVNPGWRSKEGYVAHIDAQATMTYRKASREMISKIIRWKQLPIEVRKVIAQANWQHLTAEERKVFGPFDLKTQHPATVPAECNSYFPPLPDQVDNSDGSPNPDGIYDEDMNTRIAINVVTPLMDTQNLALGSSSAHQIELAMQISSLLGTANAGSASYFADWAKLNRRDTVTMSTLAVANAYSLGDSLFGFEVGNRLRGMANPEADDGKAGMVLERQTFPALLMLGMLEDQAGPKLVRNRQNEPEVWMPELDISYNTRWSRHTRGWLWGAFDHNRSPSDSYKARNDLARARFAMSSTRDPLDQHVDRLGGESVDLYSTKKNLSRDYLVLTGNYFGNVLHTPLPATFLVADEDVETSLQDPTNKLVRANELAVYPADKVIQSNAAKASAATETQYMVIIGKNLDQVDLAGLKLQGSNLQSLDATKPPTLIGPTGIGLWVTLKGGADGDVDPVPNDSAHVQTRQRSFQFELPIKAGSPILEMMNQGSVMTQTCTYQFVLPAPAANAQAGPKKPVLASLLRDKLSAPGKVDTDKKLKGSIDVMIKGSGLGAWKQEDLTIEVRPTGRGKYSADSLSTVGDSGLFLTLDVEGDGTQACYIVFTVNATKELYYSPPLDFTLTAKP